MPPASRAARKLDVPLVTKGARKFEYENVTALHQIGRKSTSGKAARKIEPPSRMHAEVLELPDSSEDEDDGVSELKAALKALTLSGIRLKEYKRLPFLCRNVRRGFKIRCRKASVRTQPKEEPPARVKVLYRYSFDGENGSDASSSSSDLEMYEDKMGGMSRWLCPLCQVYGVFDTREMLDFHLSRDHDTVKVSWTQPIVDDVRVSACHCADRFTHSYHLYRNLHGRSPLSSPILTRTVLTQSPNLRRMKVRMKM